MKRRADALLEEVKRVEDIGNKRGGAPWIGITANVVYNFDKPILQCSVNFFDSEAECDYGPKGMPKPECVHYVVFEPIGEGGERVRRRLHPAFGPGDISNECRERAVEELKEFLQKVNEHGLYVMKFLYQRGLMWMSDEDFKEGAAKELEEANGGNQIRWMPDMGYAMEASMASATKSAFGGM
jgi:hypothetical protein